MTQDEQITLYALGALDEHEQAEVGRQLAASVHLRAQLAEEQAMLHALAAGVSLVTPPPAAKQRVMDRLLAVPVAPRRQKPATLNRPKAVSQAAPRSSLIDALRWLLSGLAIAATAIAAVLWFQINSLRTEMSALQTTLRTSQASLATANARADKLDQQVSAIQAELEAKVADLTNAQANLSQTQNALAQAQSEGNSFKVNAEQSVSQLNQARSELAVVSQPGVRAAALPALNRDYISSTATLFFAPQSNSALVTVAHLPALSPNQSYQVWLIRGDQRVPSSVFNTTDLGEGRLLVQSREPISAFQRLGITIEPAGGSASPNPDPKGLIFLGRVA